MDKDNIKTSIINLKAAKEDPDRRQACFIVISGSSAGSMFKMTSREMLIGRSKDVDVCIEEEDVSRKHAQVEERSDGQIVITDLNSTNGTFVNGKKIEQHVLNDGDRIQIASTTILKFSYQDSVEEHFQKGIFESATKDKLTKIYNRNFFTERFPQEFSYAVRHGKPFSVIIFDIDHFKKINDLFGHQAGDYVLSQLADVVSKLIRKENIFARFGGEEFVILSRDTLEEGAYALANNVREAVQSHEFRFGDKIIPVTVSVGAATYKEQNFKDHTKLFEVADAYLYKAKNKGRNRVESVFVD